MKYWGDNELFEAIKEDYNDFLSLNRGYREAIAVEWRTL
ncbi:Imm3 family immunity protein [Bacillus pseudomycoides]|nr:Imm3 family immunity protein [Bacillus pseudomycoides]MEB3052708.1 Imm3 family immunity protein [Bacillus pseudomycoides]